MHLIFQPHRTGTQFSLLVLQNFPAGRGQSFVVQIKDSKMFDQTKVFRQLNVPKFLTSLVDAFFFHDHLYLRPAPPVQEGVEVGEISIPCPVPISPFPAICLGVRV